MALLSHYYLAQLIFLQLNDRYKYSIPMNSFGIDRALVKNVQTDR